MSFTSSNDTCGHCVNTNFFIREIKKTIDQCRTIALQHIELNRDMVELKKNEKIQIQKAKGKFDKKCALFNGKAVPYHVRKSEKPS